MTVCMRCAGLLRTGEPRGMSKITVASSANPALPPARCLMVIESDTVIVCEAAACSDEGVTSA